MTETGLPEGLFYDLLGFEDLQTAHNIEVAGEFLS